jgi:RNA polymerase sigma factor for flagellar operon FliA
MTNPDDAEALFLANLGWIDRAIASLCRRQGLAGDDADDFASWARFRLMEDGYALLRKFRGESAVTTYLTVVLAMLLREHRVRTRGRWRPSAAARRGGPLAVRLEAMVRRDGCRLGEAGERLRAAGETTLGDRDLARLLEGLPARIPPWLARAGPGALEAAPAPGRADEAAEGAEAAVAREAAEAALSHALEGLPDDVRLVLRLRYWEGLSVAEIARGLGVDAKPLYRRIERALGRLRRRLEGAGVSREQVRGLLGDGGP